MTTYASYVSTVSGASVSGVVRSFDHVPLAVQTADLPAKFVRLPGGGTNLDTATTCSGDGKTRSIELVVILEPEPQDNAEPNYEATVTMMDAVETALDAIYTSSILEYDISAGTVNVGGISHWAVIVSINLTE